MPFQLFVKQPKKDFFIFLFAWQKHKKKSFLHRKQERVVRGRKRNKIKSHRHCNAAVVMMRLETSLSHHHYCKKKTLENFFIFNKIKFEVFKMKKKVFWLKFYRNRRLSWSCFEGSYLSHWRLSFELLTLILNYFKKNWASSNLKLLMHNRLFHKK